MVGDQFAEFREDFERVVPEVFRLMPLTAWTRTENWNQAGRDDDSADGERDDLRELFAGLALPPQVAGVTYAEGCRIRRVRVPGGKVTPRGGDQTVIVSKRALDEARAAHR